MTNANENARHRYTVDLSQRLADEIETISKESGRSKAEVFRVAIELLSAARAAKEQGMNVGAWDETSERRRERAFVGIV
jgi:metal-responsive CopG/Arc/MetJ family transcriptional regulator